MRPDEKKKENQAGQRDHWIYLYFCGNRYACAGRLGSVLLRAA
jgi:hypothetical protein